MMEPDSGKNGGCENISRPALNLSTPVETISVMSSFKHFNNAIQHIVASVNCSPSKIVDENYFIRAEFK